MLHKTILFLLFVSLQVFAEQNVVAPKIASSAYLTELNSEPSGVIDGLVNVITGELTVRDVSLSLSGPAPLQLARTWVSSGSYNATDEFGLPIAGWRTDGIAFGERTLGHLDFYPDTQECFIVSGDSGDVLCFPLVHNKKALHQIGTLHKSHLKHGMVNVSGGEISARSSPRNRTLSWFPAIDEFEVWHGDGSSQRFQKVSKYNFRLKTEKDPIGITKAWINDEKNKSDLRVMKSPSGKELSSCKVTYSKEGNRWLARHKASDGREFEEVLDNIHVKGDSTHNKFLVSEVRNPSKPHLKYEYIPGYIRFAPLPAHKKEPRGPDYIVWPSLSKILRPDGRGLEIKYYEEGNNYVLEQKSPVKLGDPVFKRVRKLMAPLGDGGAMLPKFQFIYYLPDSGTKGGCTGVYDALLHKTNYAFSERQRLQAIVKYSEGEVPYSVESFYWGKQDTPQEIELQSRTFGLCGKNEKKFVRTYLYDGKGNVTEESLFGEITGYEIAPLYVDENGIPRKNGVDSFTKSFSYSQDSRHLLIESKEGEVSKIYTYFPNTQLLASCLHLLQGKIFLRHFYTYDENGLVLSHIMDDGDTSDKNSYQGVTERHIETILRSESAPVGLPIVVCNFAEDLQTGSRQLIRKRMNTFDPFGNQIREEIYGSDDKLASVRQWAYDAHGNVVFEQDPIGREIRRSFDANDNLISEVGPNPFVETKYYYNQMNQLVVKEMIHPDVTLSEKFTYDLCGNKTSSEDHYGNKTEIRYDAFNRPIETLFPSILNEQGNRVRGSHRYDFDELSNPKQIIDSNGACTSFKYTILGKPYSIVYPDSSKDDFRYDLQGRLVYEKAANGLIKKYQNDALGRVVKIDVYGTEEDFLYSTESVYNTFHLLSETDPLGVITNYEYDCFGRVKETRRGDVLTRFSYDALSRVCKKTVASLSSDGEGVAYLCEYNAAGQIIEESVEALDGTIISNQRYEYDIDGNRIKVEEISEDSRSTTYITYDTHGIDIVREDAEGNKTFKQQLFDQRDSDGFRVRVLESTDSLGQKKRFQFDVMGRLKEESTTDAFGHLLSKTTFSHDFEGRCTSRTDFVLFNGDVIKENRSAFFYDNRGREIERVIALGTSEEKHVYSAYNSKGQRSSLTKADGNQVISKYNSAALLEEFYDSSESFHYKYQYSPRGEILEVIDLVRGGSTKRSYDDCSRVIEEVEISDLKNQYEYTVTGEMKRLTLPDQSSIDWVFQGLQMKEVIRKDQTGSQRYKHSFDKHCGTIPTSSTFILGLGKEGRSYDSRGLLTQISSKYYLDDLQDGYDSEGHLVKRSYQITGEEAVTERFNYNALYQLVDVSGPRNEHFAFDSLHNRVEYNGKISSFNALNQIAGEEGTSYDLNGNLIALGNEVFSYDGLDRLVEVSSPGKTTTFSYDGFHRMIHQTTDDNGVINEETILFALQNEIGIADKDNHLKILRVLGQCTSAEIGATVALEINDEVFLPIHDYRGNYVLLVDAIGDIKEKVSYSAFGEESVNSQNGQSINPWRFASKKVIGNLVLFGRRFYLPSLGRWLTPDPMGLFAGPNGYAYVNASPLLGKDPRGLMEEAGRSFLDRIGDSIHQAWHSFRSGLEKVGGYAREGIRGIGRNITQVSKHLIPVPFVRDLGGLLGHFLTNGTFNGYHSLWYGEVSQVDVGEGTPIRANIAMSYFNGMNTSLEEAKEARNHISDTFEGAPVDLIYNSTYYTVVDLMECGIQRVGIPNNPVDIAVKHLRKQISKVGSPGSDGFVILFMHSQGSLIANLALQRLTPAERAMVVTVGFGPAKIFTGKGYKYSINYISKRDLIPRISDNITWNRARFGHVPEVEFLPGNPDVFLDHDFLGDTYRDGLRRFKEHFDNELR